MTLDNFEELKGNHLLSINATQVVQDELISFTPLQTRTADTAPAKGKRKRCADAPPSGKLLLDTGALGSNVMSSDYVKQLQKHKIPFTLSAAKHSISTATKHKLRSNKFINLNIKLENERKPMAKTVNVSAAVVPLGIDLILDRDTIKENNLLLDFPSHFAEGELLDRLRQLPITTNKPVTGQQQPLLTQPAKQVLVDCIHTNPTKLDTWTGMLEIERSRQTRQALYRDQIEATLTCETARTADPYEQGAFLASLTAMPAKKKAKKAKSATQQRRDRRARAPIFTKKEKRKIDILFMTLLDTTRNLSTNSSDKSPYDREGRAGLDEIPQHKLESIPTELLNAVEEINEHASEDRWTT